jgi:hypothetical protein
VSPWLITTTAWPWIMGAVIHGWGGATTRPTVSVVVLLVVVVVVPVVGVALVLALRTRVRPQPRPSRRSTS